jgi:hypothetical protein
MLVTDWTGQLAGERVAALHRQRASTARSSRCPPAGGADPRGWPIPAPAAPATLVGEVDLPGGAGSRPEIHRLSEQTVGILQPPKELL